ncbi:type IV pili methyl-accepting chemotaxis transducer N-terminal domain-containing protein [Undibacterium sp.]|uniref:type IV pili methyl-accepting chemotaxis transducer N-terminal domain-containing protein n=1 Tax=Undibacterium sp. TaxID=1914977 RepID=UPI0025DB1706|nr:type IV pili methyl-accepting chemotaxis transducer N-terminal domain-containing protein [Undibacterium sp.]
MKRRNFLAVGLLLASNFSAISSAQAQVSSMAEAINKSGRQRMLSQRMAKAYLQIGMEVDLEKSKKILDLSLSNFDRQAVELRAFAPSPEIKSALLEMEKTWSSYKELLVGKAANKHDAKAILSLSEEMLRMNDSITSQLEKHAGSSNGQLVNLAGRQRMLSQRMAKYYQAAQWGLMPADGSAKLEAARKEFIASMNTLSKAPINNTRIKEELEMAQQQWLFFDNAIKQTEDSKGRNMAATNVATTSERLLEIMDKVTNLYQQING